MTDEDWLSTAAEGPVRPRARKRKKDDDVASVVTAAPADLAALTQRLLELESRVAKLERARPGVDLDSVPSDRADRAEKPAKALSALERLRTI